MAKNPKAIPETKHRLKTAEICGVFSRFFFQHKKSKNKNSTYTTFSLG
jgi:hypothetical protein